MLISQKSSRWQRMGKGHRSIRLNASSTDVVRIPIFSDKASGQREVVEVMKSIYGKLVSNVGDEENSMDLTPYLSLMRTLSLRAMVSFVHKFDESASEATLGEAAVKSIQIVKSYEFQSASDIPKYVWRALKTLWAQDTVVHYAKEKYLWDTYKELEAHFTDIDRLSSYHYTPSVSDVLLCRKKLNSVTETPLRHDVWLVELAPIVNSTNLNRILQFFERESVFVHCIDLASYDQLENDGKTPKLLRSVEIYKRIARHEFAKQASTIVFLTRKETFRRKLQTKSLKACFSEYRGADSYDECTKYVMSKFVTEETKSRPVYVTLLSCNKGDFKTDLRAVKGTMTTCFLHHDVVHTRQASSVIHVWC